VTRLRHVAAINPSTPQFDRLSSDAVLPFVPLEAVWSYGLDLSRRRPKGDVESGYTRFAEGDIVLPKITPTFQADRTTIATGLEGGIAAGTTELHVVRTSDRAESRYVRYLLSSRPFLRGGEAEMIGVAGQRRVPDDWLRNFSVPVLDLPEQRAIADFLDTETARIDAVVAKKRQLCAVLEDRERVRIAKELQTNASGTIPLRRLLSRPPQYGAAEPGEHGDTDWPRYIRITDLRADGSLAGDGVKRLPPEVAHPFLLHDDDLLFARSGATSGKAFRYRASMGPACFAGYLIRFRFNTARVLPALVELWTRTSHYWGQITESAVQATIQNVNAERYLELRLPDVPRSRQPALIEAMTQVRRVHSEARTRLARQIALLQEHRQALITAAVTGELEIPGVAA